MAEKYVPIKSYTKKELRVLYGDIAPSTFRSWLNRIPNFIDYTITGKGRRKKKLYYRRLDPTMVKKIFEHVGRPYAKED